MIIKKIWLVAFIFLATGCQNGSGLGNVVKGSGTIASENLLVNQFNQVSVCCGMQLYLTQGEVSVFEIEAEDNILPEITNTVTEGKLSIQYKDMNGSTEYQPTLPIRIRITTPFIQSLEISGGGNFETTLLTTKNLNLTLSGGSTAHFDSLNTGDLTLKMSGGSNLSIGEFKGTDLDFLSKGGSTANIDNLTADSLVLDSRSGGKYAISGQVRSQSVELEENGDYQAGNLQSRKIVINMTGGGRATIWATDSLEVTLDGGVQVMYYGTPQITQTLNGGSELLPLVK
jgi:Putative auto-transporter adhesin, head GIN domain